MKIFIYSGLYFPYIRGGAEYSTQIIADELVKRGFSVVVLSTFNKNQIDFIDGIKIIRIKTNIYWNYNSSQKTIFKKAIWHFLDKFNFLTEKKISKILVNENPDLIYSSNIDGLTPYSLSAAKKLKIPIIHTLRSYSLLCSRSTMFKKNRNCDKQCFLCKTLTIPSKKITNNIDGVIGISNFILGKHIEFNYFSKVPIKSIIYNPIQTKDPTKEPHFPISSNKVVFGYIGTIIKPKGIENLINVFNRYKNENIELHIYGDGEQSFLQYLKTKTTGHIIFKGYKNKEFIFANIDYLIVPSLWEEPFGRVIPEAYSFGIPVIAANIGGIKEIVNQNVGWLFNPYSKKSLEVAIKSALNNINNYSYMSENCIYESKKFKSDKIIDEYINIFTRFLK